MPQRIGEVSKDFLINVALPQHAATYTVISHKFVIDTVIAELNAKGLYIKEEYYRATAKGDIAVGVYKLNHTTDPELSMMFAWTNSYNKQVKFKAVVGASVTANEAFMILGDQGSWTRKHTGTADIEAKQHIIDQINLAGMYYDQLVADKNLMKGINLTLRQKSEWLGILFAEYNILSAEQANYVKGQMSKPSYFYNGGSDTLWAFYNHVTMSMQQAHPKSWLEDQRVLHYLITNEFGLIKPPAINDVVGAAVVPVEVGNTESIQLPGQTNLLDAIAEVEEDNSVPEPINGIEEFSAAQLSGVKAPEALKEALMNAPEIDTSEVDMSKVIWVDKPSSNEPSAKELISDMVYETAEIEHQELQEDSQEESYQEPIEDVVYNEQQDEEEDDAPWEEQAEASKQEDEYQTLVETEMDVTPEEKHEIVSFEEEEEEDEFSLFDEDDDDFELNL